MYKYSTAKGSALNADQAQGGRQDMRPYGRSTTASFKVGTTGPAFLEMKKAELINTRFPLIFK